jgi:hypothetical protein
MACRTRPLPPFSAVAVTGSCPPQVCPPEEGGSDYCRSVKEHPAAPREVSSRKSQVSSCSVAQRPLLPGSPEPIEGSQVPDWFAHRLPSFILRPSAFILVRSAVCFVKTLLARTERNESRFTIRAHDLRARSPKPDRRSLGGGGSQVARPHSGRLAVQPSFTLRSRLGGITLRRFGSFRRTARRPPRTSTRRSRAGGRRGPSASGLRRNPSSVLPRSSSARPAALSARIAYSVRPRQSSWAEPARLPRGGCTGGGAG